MEAGSKMFYAQQAASLSLHLGASSQGIQLQVVDGRVHAVGGSELKEARKHLTGSATVLQGVWA